MTRLLAVLAIVVGLALPHTASAAAFLHHCGVGDYYTKVEVLAYGEQAQAICDELTGNSQYYYLDDNVMPDSARQPVCDVSYYHGKRRFKAIYKGKVSYQSYEDHLTDMTVMDTAGYLNGIHVCRSLYTTVRRLHYWTVSFRWINTDGNQ